MCRSKFHSYIILLGQPSHPFYPYLPRYIPWWLACNPPRYPYWFGRPDPRNSLLLQELHQQAAQ